MATQGAVVIDFGPNATDRASVTVAGQATIGALSKVEAWFMAEASADHDEDAHILAANLMRLIVGSVVPGTGFTIHAVCEARASGKFNLQWVWN